MTLVPVIAFIITMLKDLWIVKQKNPTILWEYTMPGDVAFFGLSAYVLGSLRKNETSRPYPNNGIWDKFLKEEYNLTLFNVGKEHPYSEYINNLKIPVQPNNGDKSPSFLLYNLPETNNEGIINGSYVNKNYMNKLKEKAMSWRWFIMLEKLCRSGKTRNLFELLCQVYGIYFTMLAGHGNPGSKNLNVAIHEMGREFKKDDSRANTDMALNSIVYLSKLLKKAKEDHCIQFYFVQIEWLYMNNVGVIMSRTGLKMEAIEKSSGSFVAKSGGLLTTDDFFGVIGRYRFTIKFLEVIFKNEEHCKIDDGIERCYYYYGHPVILKKDSLKIIEVGFGELERIQLDTEQEGVTAFAQLSEPLCVMVFIKYMESKDESYNPLLKEMCHNFQFHHTVAIGIDQYQFLKYPNSTFFVSEDTAGPDLVFIVQFKGPGENYIDVPVFIQAKLSVNIKPAKAIRTTDPNAFYAYQKKENELGTHISELMIMIDNDEAKHFFKQEELNILNVLKKCKAEYITFKEKM
ncbi:4372_t:CDS:2, partial [Entrophospora sp. SA101]